MICSTCNVYVPTSQPVYCCIDKAFCSHICSKKQISIIQDKDPWFENPQDWSNILNNTVNYDKINNMEVLNIENDDFHIKINIKRNKPKSILILNEEQNETKIKKHEIVSNKLLKMLVLTNKIKNINIISCLFKYKYHIISIFIYIIIFYLIYKINSIYN